MQVFLPPGAMVLELLPYKWEWAKLSMLYYNITQARWQEACKQYFGTLSLNSQNLSPDPLHVGMLPTDEVKKKNMKLAHD